MNKLSFVFVTAALLAAAGCKKKGGDCAQAIDHSMALSKADMAKMPGMDDKALQKMRDIGVQRCREDGWPKEALDCMNAAKTEADARACYSKLSPDQRKKMNQAAMDAMKPAGGAGEGSAGSAGGGEMGSAGSASAPAGSAETGSGSAGSAAAPK